MIDAYPEVRECVVCELQMFAIRAGECMRVCTAHAAELTDRDWVIAVRPRPDESPADGRTTCASGPPSGTAK